MKGGESVARLESAEASASAKLPPKVVLPPGPARVMPPSAASVAADYIRTLIFEGVLREGDRVSYDDIADRLDMSRQPVREAIIELERDGVVVSKPKRGTFVGQFNARTVEEHHAVYGLLEGHAARQVATAQDPKVLARLRELLSQANAATTPGQRIAIGSHFLNVIDTEGSDARLRALLHQIARFVPKKYYAEHIPDPDMSDRLKRILDAIEAGDPDAANAAVVQLWREAGDQLLEHLYETGVFTRAASADAAMP
jgi:DNA-binding GntR family transcriptional regulator